MPAFTPELRPRDGAEEMVGDGEIKDDAIVTMEVGAIDGAVEDVLWKLNVAIEAGSVDDVDANGVLERLAMIACDATEAADIDERYALVVVDGIS